jgi:hypothetical protein
MKKGIKKDLKKNLMIIPFVIDVMEQGEWIFLPLALNVKDLVICQKGGLNDLL